LLSCQGFSGNAFRHFSGAARVFNAALLHPNWRLLDAVDLSSVPDLDDDDNEFLIPDSVDDSPGALANPILIRLARKFLATRWMRILGKPLDALNHFPSDRLRLD